MSSVIFIDEDSWGNDEDYSPIKIKYYAEDGIFVDDYSTDDVIYPSMEEDIGGEAYRELLDTKETVYCRNSFTMQDYRVEFVDDSYFDGDETDWFNVNFDMWDM